MDSNKQLHEDGVPANAVGGGQIAAVGVTPPGYPKNWGEPPKTKDRKALLGKVKTLLKRKVPNVGAKLPS